MPDTPNNTYSRTSDFLDTGFSNLRDINYQAPASTGVFPVSPTSVNPKDALDYLFANLRTSVAKENPFLSSLNITTPISTPLAQTERYASKKYGFDPLNPNIETQYGDRQGTLETWKNYILKFGANTLGSFLQGLVTIPYVVEGAIKGDMSNVYDNPTTNDIQNWFENLETTLPTYRTSAQENNPVLSWIPLAAGSAHNWGSLLQNLGFTVGSVASALLIDAGVGAVIGGSGVAPLLGPQMMRAFGKLGKFYTTEGGVATTLSQGLQRGEDLYQIIDKATRNARNIDKFRYGLSIGTSAFAEGAFEANQTYRNIKEILTNEFIEKRGYEPSGEDAERIEEYARGGGNADLFANVALLSLTNSAVFGSLFKPVNAARKSVATQLIGDEDIVLKGDIFEKAVNAKKFSLINTTKAISRPLRVSGIEGIEEGAQFAFQRSAEDYYKRKFNDETIDEVDNFFMSLGTGLKDTLTTREGLENVFMGMLSGGVIHGARKLAEKRRGIDTNRDSVISSTLAILNSQRLSGLFRTTYDEAVTSQSIANDMRKAIENDDIFEYKNLQLQQLFNFVESGIRANRYEMRIDQLNMLKEVKPEQFQQMFGINFSEENKKTVAEYADSIINKATAIKENIDKVNRFFTNPYKKGTENYLIFEEYKSQLALDLSEIEDHKRRLASIQGNVANIVPGVNLTDLMSLTNDKGLSEAVINFQKRVDELSDSIEFLEDKESDFYKKQVVERAYLQKKIVDLKEALDDFNGEEFQKHAFDLINYYANNKGFDKKPVVDKLDVAELLKLGQDAFKITNSSDRAYYHYQRLTSKEGFEENWADLVSEYSIQEEKFEKKFETTEQPEEAPTEQKLIEGVENIDKQGNVIKPTQPSASKSNIPPARPSVDITPVENLEVKKDDIEKRKNLSLTKQDDQTKEKFKKEGYTRDFGYFSNQDKTKWYGTHLGDNNNSNTEIEANSEKELIDKINDKYNAELAALQSKGQTVPEGFVDASTPVPVFEDEEQNRKAKQTIADKKKGTVTNTLGFKKSNPLYLFNRIFTKDFADGTLEKTNLREALFSQSPESFRNSLSLSIAEATKGLKPGEIKLFPNYKDLYFTGFALDINVISNGKVIGKVQPAERLIFKKSGKYIPLYDITIEDYERVTGNDLDSFEDFKKHALAYKSITDKIVSDFKKGKTEYSNTELQALADIISSYGNIEFSKSEATSTKLKDIEYKGKGSAILSFAMYYDKESKTFKRTTVPQILNKEQLTDEEINDVYTFLKDNVQSIINQDRRYIYLMKLPDGKFHKFSAITARPGKPTQAQLDEIFKEINLSASQRYRTNVAKTNNTLKEKVYIADSRNRKELKSSLYLSINSEGKLFLNVYNDLYQVGKRLDVTEGKDAKNFDEMIDRINQKLALLARRDSDLDRLNIRLDKKDFSLGIYSDAETTLEQLEENLTVSVPREVFNTFSVTLLPKGAALQSAPTPKVEVKTEPEVAPTPKEKILDLSPAEQEIYDTIISNLSDIKGEYRLGIEVMSKDDSMKKEIINSLVQQYINNWDLARDTFGAKISDSITKNIPEAAKAEANNIETFKSAKEVKGLKQIFESLFGLKPKQAAAVAEIYDKTAEAWAVRNNASKFDFYSKLAFQKVADDYQFTDDVLTQLEPDPLVRELFRRKNFEPVGNVFTTNQLARERFNISKLKFDRYIGGGSDRDVYDLGDNKVLKIAKTARGLLQNDIENDVILYENGIIPTVYEIGDNYIVVEKVEPADIYDYDVQEINGKWFVVGTSQVSYLADPDDQKFIEAKSQKDAIRIKNELKDKNSPAKLVTEFKEAARTIKDPEKRKQKQKQILDKYGLNGDIIFQYDFLSGDFQAVNNWGIKNGKPIHLDGGTFDKKMVENTPERKIAEDEFREIRIKTRKLANKFRDIDRINTPLLYQIAGEKGVKNLKDSKDILFKLKEANRLENKGLKSVEIFDKTGWERGKDNKWRYQLPYGNLTDDARDIINSNNPYTSIPLGSFYNAPILYNAYPDLINIPVFFEETKRTARGSFNSDLPSITLNKELLKTEDSVKKTLIHEIQHYIQHIEGFEKGANISFFKKTGFKSYKKTAGEVEARNASNRSVNKILQGLPFSSTEDIDRNEQILIEDYRIKLKESKEKSGINVDGTFYNAEDNTINIILRNLKNNDTKKDIITNLEDLISEYDSLIDDAIFDNSDVSILEDRKDRFEEFLNDIKNAKKVLVTIIDVEELSIDETSLFKTPQKQFSNSAMLANVIKGFDLKKVEGFGMAFQTKTGTATPNLANKINKWLQDNGYNSIKFVYEATYKTVNPFVKQDNILFQSLKPYSEVISSKLTADKLLDIINRLEDKIFKTQEESFDIDEYQFFSTNLQSLKQSLLKDKSDNNIFRIFQQLLDLQINDVAKVLLEVGYSKSQVELLYNELTPNITTYPDFVKGNIFTDFNKAIHLVDPYIEPYLLNQQAKGAIRLMDDGNAIIYALTNPDVSTPLHELAHFWERQLTDIERDEVLEWAGLGDEWTTETSEKFARGFERYLAEGIAPNNDLKKLFENFKKWLREIYKVVIGNQYFADVELNDSMRAIYSKMIGENFEQELQEEVEQEKAEEQQKTEPGKPSVEIPKLSTVVVDLSSLSIDELKNVARQLRQKAVDARDAEKQGKTVLGGSAFVESDYQAVKKYIADLENQEKTTREKKFAESTELPVYEGKTSNIGGSIIEIAQAAFKNKNKKPSALNLAADKLLINRKETEEIVSIIGEQLDYAEKTGNDFKEFFSNVVDNISDKYYETLPEFGKISVFDIYDPSRQTNDIIVKKGEKITANSIRSLLKAGVETVAIEEDAQKPFSYDRLNEATLEQLEEKLEEVKIDIDAGIDDIQLADKKRVLENRIAELKQPVEKITESVETQSIKDYADRLEKMTEDELENVDFYENRKGYEYYMAKKIMPKKENSTKFRKVKEEDAPLFDYEYIANVNGIPYGLSKEEDPDDPDNEKAFVWLYTRMDNPDEYTETTISDNKELIDFIIASQNKVTEEEVIEEQVEELNPQVFTQEDIGKTVIYKGKEVTVEDIIDLGNNRFKVMINDGTKYGQSYVNANELQKIDPVVGEPVYIEEKQTIDEGLLKDLNIDKEKEEELKEVNEIRAADIQKYSTISKELVKEFDDLYGTKFSKEYRVIEGKVDLKEAESLKEALSKKITNKIHDVYNAKEKEIIKKYKDKEEEDGLEEDVNNTFVNYIGLKLILENLKSRFNIPYSVVASDENWKGRFENGVAIININKVTRDTPFHEYLHPFMAVMKVDNPELYKSLIQSFDNLLLENDDLAGESMDEVTKSEYYKNKTREEQKEEALIRSISKLAAKNVDRTSKKIKSQAVRIWNELMAKIRWFIDAVIQGFRYDPDYVEKNKLDKRNPMTKRGYVLDRSKAGISQVKDLPENLTAQDVADLLSASGISFDMSNHAELVNKLNEFQADDAEKTDDQKIIDIIKRKVKVLEDTARRRTPSDILMSEAIAVKGILKNTDEIESINNYVYRGIQGLDFANDEFKRIVGRLKEDKPFTKNEILDLSKSLSLVKNLLAFYEDTGKLFKRISDELDEKDYKRFNNILLQANNNKDSIKSRSVDIITEWLFPYIEEFNEKIESKYPEYVLTKQKFKNRIYTAEDDSNLLFYWLGSISSSNDPVAGVVRTALFDVMEENHLFEAELGEEIKTIYNKFLEKKGLKNEIKQTEDYYKNNYLRKATTLYRTEEKDENDKYIYKYTTKWAFHEEFYYDLYVKEKDDFLENLTSQYKDGVRPDEGTKEYQDFVDKIIAWEKVNGSLSAPAERFRNPNFEKLYNNDTLFKKLYDTYKDANSKLSDDEQLKYGIIPQVSKGRSAFTEIKKKEGIVSKVKEIGGQIVNFALPVVENDTTISDTQENLDGSLYRKKIIPYTHFLEEDDLSLVLPETVFKYAGVANHTHLMREVEPQVNILKSLLDGNSKFVSEARKINKVSSDRKTIFDHVLGLPAKRDRKVERLNKQLSTWLDDAVYGVSELQSEVNLGKRKIDMNRLGGNLAFLTALNNMAFNVTAGVSNIAIGNIFSLGEAMGGKYWTASDWRKAQSQYFGNFNEFMKDAFRLNKSKITQLGIKYDAIQGEFRDKYGKKFVGNVAQRYATSDTFFIINHAAEHQIQLIGMLSLMNATKVKTNDGQVISLFDAHVINDQGYLRLRKDIEWTAEQEKDFTRRLHGLNKLINGNYSKFDKVHLQRTWIGKLLLIYRKFIYNGFRARYGKKRPDYEIGDVMEGYYRKFFGKLVTDIRDYKFEAARRFYKREGWTEDEKYAANKTLFEMSAFMATLIITLALSAADDDDDKTWAENYLALMTMRIRSDVATYSVFGSGTVLNIIQNPSAVILTLTRYGQVLAQIAKNPFETYDKKTGAFDEGDSILMAKVLKALPIIRQFVNLLQPEEQKKFFKFLNRY